MFIWVDRNRYKIAKIDLIWLLLVPSHVVSPVGRWWALGDSGLSRRKKGTTNLVWLQRYLHTLPTPNTQGMVFWKQNAATILHQCVQRPNLWQKDLDQSVKIRIDVLNNSKHIHTVKRERKSKVKPKIYLSYLCPTFLVWKTNLWHGG